MILLFLSESSLVSVFICSIYLLVAKFLKHRQLNKQDPFSIIIIHSVTLFWNLCLASWITFLLAFMKRNKPNTPEHNTNFSLRAINFCYEQVPKKRKCRKSETLFKVWYELQKAFELIVRCRQIAGRCHCFWASRSLSNFSHYGDLLRCDRT